MKLAKPAYYFATFALVLASSTAAAQGPGLKGPGNGNGPPDKVQKSHNNQRASDTTKALNLVTPVPRSKYLSLATTTAGSPGITTMTCFAAATAHRVWPRKTTAVCRQGKQSNGDWVTPLGLTSRSMTWIETYASAWATLRTAIDTCA